MLALLTALGIAFDNTATDEQLAVLIENAHKTRTTPAPQNTQNTGTLTKEQIDSVIAQNNELKKFMDETKRQRIVIAVDKLVADDKLPLTLRDKVVEQAMKDETALEIYAAMPAKPPGAQNVATPTLKADASPMQRFEHIANIGPRFTNRLVGPKGADVEVDGAARKQISANAKEVNQIYRKHKAELVDYLSSRNPEVSFKNSNTIDSVLQRTVILQEMLEAFQPRVIPLEAFSVVFNNVPLEGTDEIAVPYFPLQSAASTSFNGTYSTGNTTENSRTIYVGGGGSAKSNATGIGGVADRLYQGMAFSSYELRRQPYLNLQKLAVQNANKLGIDVFTSIVQNVITISNFGAPAVVVPAAAFTADNVADMYSAATSANWPEVGRSLALNHTYNAALLKDPSFKYGLNYGSTDPIRKGKIQEAYGFEDIYAVPNLASYFTNSGGSSLQGWLAWRYAVGVAFSPIMPTPAVRQLLVQYDVAVNEWGMTLEYRQWGVPSTDSTNEVVECNFGAAPFVQTALQLLSAS